MKEDKEALECLLFRGFFIFSLKHEVCREAQPAFESSSQTGIQSESQRVINETENLPES